MKTHAKLLDVTVTDHKKVENKMLEALCTNVIRNDDYNPLLIALYESSCGLRIVIAE